MKRQLLQGILERPPALLTLTCCRRRVANDIHSLLESIDSCKSARNSIDIKRAQRTMHAIDGVRLQVIGDGGHGTTKSLLLGVNGGDQTQLLFNCGEGVARTLAFSPPLSSLGGSYASNRNTSSINNLSHIFMTRRSWPDCAAGTFSLISSLQSRYFGRPNAPSQTSLTFHAPFDFKDFLDRVFHLLRLLNFDTRQHDYARDGASTFVHGQMSVDAIELLASNQPPPSPPPPHGVDRIVYAYLCSFATAASEPRRILVLDVPDSSFLPALRSKLANQPIDLVVHLSPREMLNSDAYLSLVSAMWPAPASTHLLVDSSSSSTSKSPLIAQIHQTRERLNRLNERMFPLPRLSSTSLSEQSHTIITQDYRAKFEYALSSAVYELKLNANKLVSRDYSSPNFHAITIKSASKQQQQQQQQKRQLNDEQAQSDNTSLVFLGTSNSLPTQHRNNSGILLHIDANRSFLLDCGEDTTGQLMRFYGDKTSWMVEMTKIKAVFISHSHTDHHMGFYRLLDARRTAFDALGQPYEKLFVCYPTNLNTFFEAYETMLANHDFSQHVCLIDNDTLVRESFSAPSRKIEQLHLALNVRCVETVPVAHAAKSSGIVLELKSGLKLVYSGDCRPTTRLIERGHDCHLLIHEATYEDEPASAAHALKNKHSTLSEAIRVGVAMKARRIVLTHIGRRLASTPDGIRALYAKCDTNGAQLLVAHDNMVLDIDHQEPGKDGHQGEQKSQIATNTMSNKLIDELKLINMNV